MKKRFGAILLVACMICMVSVPAYAGIATANTQGLTEDNIAHVDMIFAKDSGVCITDANGNDVTLAFVMENGASYSAGDYVAVLDAIIEDELVIEIPAVEPRLVVNGSVKSSYYTVYFDSSVTGGQTKEYIQFQFTGSYQYNDSTNTITQGTGISIAKTGAYASTLAKTVSITAPNTWSISNNGKKITFTAGYSAKIYTGVGALADTKTGTKTFSKTYS